MNSYSNYQKVDSYWYDQIPSSWTKTKNKFLFMQKKFIVGKEWDKFVLLTMGKSGVKPRDVDAGGKFPESFETYQKVNPNQIVFCLFDIDETPRTVGLSKDKGMITSAYDVFSLNKGQDPQFWTYFYQVIDDHKGLRPYYTGLRKVVRNNTFMGIEVFAPPIEEQNLISRYLEKETRKIDNLIKKIEKKIQLLKEQKTALINQYVTKGVEQNVSMKDSGIEWIGKIPKHWEVKKLRYLGFLSNGISKGSEFFKSGEPFLTYSDVYKNYSLTSPSGVCLSNEKDWDTYSVKYGDIFFTRTSETNDDIGISSVCLKTIDKCCFSGFLIRFRPFEKILDPEYSKYFFRSSIPVIHFSKEMNKVTRASLSQQLLKSSPVLIPPQHEQKVILKNLTFKLENLEKISFLNQTKVDRLKEYRQSLISSVVTGKIKITEDMI